MPYKENFTVYSEIYTKHISTPWGLFNVNTNGIHTNR